MEAVPVVCTFPFHPGKLWIVEYCLGSPCCSLFRSNLCCRSCDFLNRICRFLFRAEIIGNDVPGSTVNDDSAIFYPGLFIFLYLFRIVEMGGIALMNRKIFPDRCPASFCFKRNIFALIEIDLQAILY